MTKLSPITFNDMLRGLEIDTITYYHAYETYNNKSPIFKKHKISQDDYHQFLMGHKDLPHAFLKDLYGLDLESDPEAMSKEIKNFGFSKGMLENLERDSDPYPDGSKTK